MSERSVILLVEDERQVQDAIGDALYESGFDLEFIDSGEGAVMLLKSFNNRYRAIVIDIALRGKMSGWEVGTRARQIDPSFPVVYISGFYASHWLLRGVPDSLVLAKPFDPVQLVTALFQLLNPRQ